MNYRAEQNKKSYLAYIGGKEQPDIEILRATGDSEVERTKSAVKNQALHPLILMNTSIQSNSSNRNSPKNSVKKQQAPQEDMARLSITYAKKLTRA